MTPKSNDTKAFYAGSFNPFTVGHKDIADRALQIADRLVIAVGHNIAKSDDSLQLRLDAIRAVYADDPRVEVTSYSTLTVDAARSMGCSFLVRGVRSVSDFEFELNLADINRDISGLETILLPARPEFAHISSSALRELAAFGHDISKYLPS